MQVLDGGIVGVGVVSGSGVAIIAVPASQEKLSLLAVVVLLL